MHNRLRQFIKYKGVKLHIFATLLGWTPPYLSKLLRGENFGLQPIITLADVFPELNIRWLLTGKGEMLTPAKQTELRQQALRHIQEVLDLEKYMPFMNAEEMGHYENMILNHSKPNFTPEQIRSWEELLCAKEDEINAKFSNINIKE